MDEMNRSQTSNSDKYHAKPFLLIIGKSLNSSYSIQWVGVRNNLCIIWYRNIGGNVKYAKLGLSYCPSYFECPCDLRNACDFMARGENRISMFI